MDRAKALAAICVVAIHTQSFFVASPGIATRLLDASLEWAVPCFFFVGGYVRSRTTPYPPGTTRGWLERLVPAYVLASLLALLFEYVSSGQAVSPVRVLHQLAVGSAFGIFYFVPLFAGALVFSHVLARHPRSVGTIAVFSLACLVLTRMNPDLDPFWRMNGFYGINRSPFFWWGYFVAGWIAKPWLERATSRKRMFLLSSAAALAGLVGAAALSAPLATALARVCASIAIPVSLILWPRQSIAPAMAMLGEYSYEIYLFHYFAIAAAHECGYSESSVVMRVAVGAAALATGLVAGIVARRIVQVSMRAAGSLLTGGKA